MSPTTPPPSAYTTVLRSQALASSASKTRFSVCQFLCSSPSGSATTRTALCFGASTEARRDAYSGATVVFVTMRACVDEGTSAQAAGSSIKPVPMRMS